MGAIGGIIYLAVAAVMYPNAKIAGLAHVNYQPLFLVVSAVMLVSVAVLFLTVKEPARRGDARALERRSIPSGTSPRTTAAAMRCCPSPSSGALASLLVSIALWYIGYNGVTTWWSTYVGAVMGQGLGGASTCLLIATAGAVVSYIPIGQLASRIGRKKTILFGCALLAAMFLTFYFLTTLYSTIHPVMFVCFALVGFAWAAINVNSLPMVLEMCRGSDTGKFTGFYTPPPWRRRSSRRCLPAR